MQRIKPFLVIDTAAEFDTIQDAVHKWCIQNVSGYSAQRWAEATIKVRATGKYLLAMPRALTRFPGRDVTQVDLYDTDIPAYDPENDGLRSG